MANVISPERLKREPERFDSCPSCGKPKCKIAKNCSHCSHKIFSGKNHPRWKGGRKENKKRAKIYNQSERRKAYQKAYQKAYRQSERGKAILKCYAQSEKHKAAQEAYRQSGKRKITRKIYYNNYKELTQNFIMNFKAQVGCQYDSCPENNPFLLEFHHPNGRQKNEKHLSPSRSWKEIFRICKECAVLCCNHHRFEHREKLLGV